MTLTYFGFIIETSEGRTNTSDPLKAMDFRLDLINGYERGKLYGRKMVNGKEEQVLIESR